MSQWESGKLVDLTNADATVPSVAPPLYVGDWWGALIDLEITAALAGVGATLLTADSFNRADSTTNLGSTDGAGTLDPIVWVQQQGGTGWGINTNQAYTPSGAGLPQEPIATVDVGTGDVDVKVSLPAVGNQCGLVFRWTDINNYFFVFNWVSSPQCFWGKFQNGVFTNFGTVAGLYANGSTMEVIAQGSSLSLLRNGVVIATRTDGFNAAATKHGLLTQNAFTPNVGGDNVVRFDNFSITAPPPQLLELDMTWGELNQQGTDLAPNPFPPLSFVIANGQPLLHAVSHRGPYLKLAVARSLVTKYNLRLRHTNRQERPAELFDGPLINFSGFIDAGTNRIFPFPGYVGPIYAFASSTPGANGLLVAIHGVDVNGVDYVLDQIFTSGAVPLQQPRLSWLPGLACYVRVSNTDAAQHTINFNLTPAYR